MKYKKFSDRLRQARLDSNLTQEAVCQVINKSPNYMSKIESGKKRIPMDIFIKLLKIYKKPPEYFFTNLNEE
ncbi:DNA-binding helix-turn-helix protein [Leptospira broomii serovar Hurstbridge str. 5399]|uniref:DNA-binding helix-turn-helix protein n=1 Tax=Leptospira broomii serovar Hurstbridge str. 5399 TaxID=1049789 RepID=T0GEC8_9LEPT|nr:DNA-binding helix-turn-helix protein [Leptospira broomii serovar Hurstbridge str. 5399]